MNMGNHNLTHCGIFHDMGITVLGLRYGEVRWLE